MTNIKQSTAKAIKLEFAPGEKVTSFGGMAVVGRLLGRLGVRRLLERSMPERGGYSFFEVISSAMTGLLTGARGTFATQVVREDAALLRLSGLDRAPEEATFWRALGSLGGEQALGAFEKATLRTARRAVESSSRTALFDNGFLPVFLDGTLLEGSARREGTKCWKEGREGLLWTVGFVGPYPVLGELAREGCGETTAARRIVRRIAQEVLAPAKLKKDALVLADSLHGNGPTFEVIEAEGLPYIIGAMNLVRAETVLAEQPEMQWTRTPAHDAAWGVEESGVSVASIQCEGWTRNRTLVGRRCKKNGEMIWSYASLITDLTAEDPRVAAIMRQHRITFAEAVWRLYDRKGACENHFKNLLIDLGLHHPPCREWQRNAAFYALGLFTGLIATALDVLGSAPTRRRRTIATLRRHLLAVPARVSQSGRTLTATVLGLSERWRAWITDIFTRVARC